MRKMMLNVDELRVESFFPAAVASGRGTVDGHAVKPSVTCETQVETCETHDCPIGPGPSDSYPDCLTDVSCVTEDWVIYTCSFTVNPIPCY